MWGGGEQRDTQGEELCELYFRKNTFCLSLKDSGYSSDAVLNAGGTRRIQRTNPHTSLKVNCTKLCFCIIVRRGWGGGRTPDFERITGRVKRLYSKFTPRLSLCCQAPLADTQPADYFEPLFTVDRTVPHSDPATPKE